MDFRIGGKVKIKQNIDTSVRLGWVKNMDGYKGRIMTVKNVIFDDDGHRNYELVGATLDNEYWQFSEDMFDLTYSFDSDSGRSLILACIEEINDEQLRKYAKFLLDIVPQYFWSVPASSSGKYHPKFSNGYGGLVRHTFAAFKWLKELQQNEQLAVYNFDVAMFAVLFHDVCKLGRGNVEVRETYYYHSKFAKDFVTEWLNKYISNNKLIAFDATKLKQYVELASDAILSHMGQWFEYKIRSQEASLVHLADYCASRTVHELPELQVNEKQEENENDN